MGNVFFRVGVFVCMPPGYSILRLEGFVSVLVCLFLKELKKSEYGMMCECVVGASWVVGRGSRVRVLRNVEINFFCFRMIAFQLYLFSRVARSAPFSYCVVTRLLIFFTTKLKFLVSPVLPYAYVHTTHAKHITSALVFPYVHFSPHLHTQLPPPPPTPPNFHASFSSPHAPLHRQ